MYDRFSELKGIKSGDKNPKDTNYIVINIDEITPKTSISTENNEDTVENKTDIDTNNKGLIAYMKHIDLVKLYIEKINSSSHAISILMTNIVSTSTAKQEEDLSNKLNAIVNQTNDECSSCKNEILKLSREKDFGNSTEAQIMENAYNVTLKNFQDALKKYRDAQTEFRKAIKAKTTRQLQIAYPEMNDEDIKKVENGSYKAIESLLQSKIIGTRDLKDAIIDIQEKYKDVISLEKSVEDLHQMIVDLASIVSYQGELIYQIESNAFKSVEYTAKAKDELKLAEDYKRKGSKMMIILSFALAIGSVFILVPLIFKIT